MVSGTKRQPSGSCSAAATAETAACVRAINIGHAFTNTPPRSNVRDVDFDRFGLYCDAPHIFNLNL